MNANATQSSQDFEIFIGGLASNASNQELMSYFSQFGKIQDCKVQVWKNNPTKCRGFALLSAGDHAAYNLILATAHKFNGRPIECKKLIKDKNELNSYSKDLTDRKLFVSGLAKSVTDVDLKNFFSQFGPVEIAYIIKHHKDNKSKGFGFISFVTKAGRDLALSSGPELEINGKKVVCSAYCSKSEGKQTTASNESEDTKLSDKTSTKQLSESAEESKLNENEDNYGFKRSAAPHFLYTSGRCAAPVFKPAACYNPFQFSQFQSKFYQPNHPIRACAYY